MSDPAQNTPPLNQGQYRIFVDGYAIGTWTHAKIPLLKVKVTSNHEGGAPVASKWPSGHGSVDDAEFTGFQGTDGRFERSTQTWLLQCVNPRDGRTTVAPQRAKKDVVVEQTDTDGRVVHEWVLHGCFPVEGGEIAFEAGSEKVVERKLKLSVDWPEFVR